MTDLHDQRILVLDFGGQTTQLIARRVRECGVYCEIHPWDISDDVVREFKASGVILSGGPESVIASGSPVIPQAVLDMDMPILGICYGMQAMVHQRVAKFVHKRLTVSSAMRLCPCTVVPPCSIIWKIIASMTSPCWMSG